MGPDTLPSYVAENIKLPDSSGNSPGVVQDDSALEVEVEVEKRYMSFFKKFWQVYPSRNGKKLGKAEAEAVFKELKLSQDLPLICRAAKNFAASKQVKAGIGIPDAKRFIRKAKKVEGKHVEPWRDWITPEGEDSSEETLKRKRKGLKAAIKHGEAGGKDDRGNAMTEKLLKELRAELDEVERRLKE